MPVKNLIHNSVVGVSEIADSAAPFMLSAIFFGLTIESLQKDEITYVPGRMLWLTVASSQFIAMVSNLIILIHETGKPKDENRCCVIFNNTAQYIDNVLFPAGVAIGCLLAGISNDYSQKHFTSAIMLIASFVYGFLANIAHGILKLYTEDRIGIENLVKASGYGFISAGLGGYEIFGTEKALILTGVGSLINLLATLQQKGKAVNENKRITTMYNKIVKDVSSDLPITADYLALLQDEHVDIDNDFVILDIEPQKSEETVAQNLYSRLQS